MTKAHDHTPVSAGTAFAVGIGLNLLFVFIELGFGVWSHSLALIGDAGHNFGDVFGLALAWGAATLARRAPTQRRTYGLKRTTILAALANTLVLVGLTFAMAWAAFQRIRHPEPVSGWTMIVVAAIGVVINAVTAWIFMTAGKRDLNLRAAFLHLLGDAAVSVGVVIAGAAYLWTGASWIDPAASLVIGATILAGTWSVLSESLDLALDAVPRDVDIEDVRRALAGDDEIRSVHDLHIWGMSTTENALTAHVVVDTHRGNKLLSRLSEMLHDKFEIRHSVLQIEVVDASFPCATRCGEKPGAVGR